MLLAAQEFEGSDEPESTATSDTSRRKSLRRVSLRLAAEAVALGVDEHEVQDVCQNLPTVRLSARKAKQRNGDKHETDEDSPQSLPTVRGHRSTSADCEDLDSPKKSSLVTTKSGVIEVRSRRERKAPTRWADDPLAVVELGGSADKLRTASAETVINSSELQVDQAVDVELPTPVTALLPEPEPAPNAKHSNITVGTKLICVKKSQARGKRNIAVLSHLCTLIDASIDLSTSIDPLLLHHHDSAVLLPGIN